MKYRLKCGLRQIDVANHVGVSQVSVWQWDNGKSLPTADKLETISKLFGCTIEDLLRKEE